jgi:hypothetical protein
MNRYFYSGPVMEFNNCVQSKWEGATMAPTEKKARSNLTYQWKKQNNRIAGSKIFLPGKIELIEIGGM